MYIDSPNVPGTSNVLYGNEEVSVMAAGVRHGFAVRGVCGGSRSPCSLFSRGPLAAQLLAGQAPVAAPAGAGALARAAGGLPQEGQSRSHALGGQGRHRHRPRDPVRRHPHARRQHPDHRRIDARVPQQPRHRAQLRRFLALQRRRLPARSPARARDDPAERRAQSPRQGRRVHLVGGRRADGRGRAAQGQGRRRRTCRRGTNRCGSCGCSIS